MKLKTSKMSIIVITSISAAWLAACSPQFVTSSNEGTPVKAATPPAKGGGSLTPEQIQAKKAQEIAFGAELQKFLDAPDVPATPEHAQEIKKSQDDLAEAEKNNFQDITNDGDPEDPFSSPSAFEGLIPRTPEVGKQDPAPKIDTKPGSSSPQPAPAIPGDTVTKPRKSTIDIYNYKNPYCEKLGTNGCIKASNQPIAQSWNYYATKGNTMGQLWNATELPMEGLGFHIKTSSKERRFGAKQTIEFIENLGKINFPNKLVVGDISKNSGGFLGRMVNGINVGHKSHQNGLDVDIGFIGLEKSNETVDLFPLDFIKNGKIDSTKFDIENNWRLVSEAVNSGSTYIIFAHSAVKKAFCERAKKSTEGLEAYANRKVLSQIIPEDGHYNHFHFRLKCVESSPCIPGPIRPEDHGCK